MKHSNGINLVLLELSKLGAYAARREVGTYVNVRGLQGVAAWVKRNNQVPSLSEMFMIAGGATTIGVNGEADIQGIYCSIPIAVEIKVGKDAQRADQKSWAEAWRRHGGVYMIVKPDRDGWQNSLREELIACKE